ncbi:MAG: sulfurtransferase, partial [Armatimonadetes bacterium]|nr:sulfurtransferase [Anaerolineae bacterium]
MTIAPNTLVTTLWLHEQLNAKPEASQLRIVDIRGKVLPPTDPQPQYHSHRAAYEESHIPGAVFVDWITDITQAGPDHMQIAPPDKFAALMGNLGIGAQTFVVAYDDAGGMLAARLWW